MVFSTPIFLFYFLALTLLVYYLVPRKGRNVVLLISSLFFYYWGEREYVAIMFLSTAIDYTHGMLVERCKNKGNDKGARLAVASSIIFNLALLLFFKYWDFLAGSLQAMGLTFMPVLGIHLPIGISFYTFQTMSYTIDVYRGDTRAQRSIINFGTFVTLFPQLIAGPIIKYKDLGDQINERTTSTEKFASGVQMFMVGMAKKVLVANNVGMLWEAYKAMTAGELTVLGAWLGVIAFTFQIYFDFSGYSDMAIGLGKMMGFEYPRNFNYPYTSRSATEFWRRWHMSLGGFFRDYVYIPLGGNRVSTPRFILNTMIVWGLTGIWHGAAWNFLLWGLYWGVLILLEKFFVMRVLDRLPRFVSHIWCIVLFFFGWLLFAVTGLTNVGEWFCAMFGAYGWLGTSTLWELQSWSYVSLVPIFIVGSLPWAPWLRKKIQAWAEGDPHRAIVAAPQKGNTAVPPCQVVCEGPVPAGRARAVTAVNVLADVALLVVFVLSCMSVVSSSYNPFIYFQF